MKIKCLHNPSWLIVVSVCSLMVSCTDTAGDSGSISDPSPAQRMSLSLSASVGIPGNEIIATIGGAPDGKVDTATVELRADLGQGIVARLPFRVVAPGQIAFGVPIGVFTSGRLATAAGNASIVVSPRHSTSILSSNPVLLSISPGSPPSMKAGDLSIAYLSAERELLLKSIGNYALLDARTSTLSSQKISAITQEHNRQIDLIRQMIGTIQKAQAGQPQTIGSLKGSSITLTTESLPLLDRYLYSVYRLSPKPKSSNVISDLRYSAVQDVESEFDIKGLMTEIAQNAREIAQRNRSVFTTTLSVIGAGALVLGAPELALASAGLAAITWFTTTAAGAAIGLSLEAGSSSILDGKAKLDDFKATGGFLADAYKELGVDYATDKVLTGVLGDMWGAVAQSGISVISTVSSFLNTDVPSAFASGDIPTAGFAASSFTVSITTQYSGGTTYSIVARTTPAVSGAKLQIQVSGTDGYRATQNVTTSGGVASVSIPSGAKGVSDSINGYHLDGRAQAATIITF